MQYAALYVGILHHKVLFLYIMCDKMHINSVFFRYKTRYLQQGYKNKFLTFALCIV